MEETKEISQEVRDLKIADMTFAHNPWITTRVRNVLGQYGIHTLGQLLECTIDDLTDMQKLGEISRAHLKAKLESMGLKLKEPGW